MKKAVIIALVLAVLLIGVCGVMAFIPGDYRVERSRSIAASPAEVHAVVSDLETWKQWTAWTEERDPDAVWIFHGEPGQVGHGMNWTGPVLKSGTLTFTAVHPDGGVEYDMSFDEGDSKGSLLIEPSDTGSLVTWAFWGEAPMLLTFVIDAAGKDFEDGLAGLQAHLNATGDAPEQEQE